MSTIKPFRGLYYTDKSTKSNNLSRVVCPPYDMISNEQKEELIIKYDPIVRKIAHVSVFFILTIYDSTIACHFYWCLFGTISGFYYRYYFMLQRFRSMHRN